jgi:hypothetical protein
MLYQAVKTALSEVGIVLMVAARIEQTILELARNRMARCDWLNEGL